MAGGVVKITVEASGQQAISEISKIQNAFTGLTSSSAWKNVMMGVGVGIGVEAFHLLERGISDVINVIPDLIGKGMAFAETVHTIQETTGATAEEASHLAGTWTYLGVNADSMTLKLGVLAKYITAHADVMNSAGIATTDAAGKTLNMATIVDNARHVLSQYTDGAEKSTAAVKLFGRAGLEMIEYLNLSDAQVTALNAKLDSLGVTLDANGIAKAKSVGREFNLMGLSIQGVANRLLTDLEPVIGGAIEWFSQLVAAHGRDLADFVGKAINFIVGMVNSLLGANLPLVTFSDTFGKLGTNVSTAGANLDMFGAATKTSTKAIDDQIKAIDKQTASLKDLESEQDKAFTKRMAQLGAEVDAQTKAIDASEKAHSVEEQRNKLATDMLAAQDALAKARNPGAGKAVDPSAVKSALDQLSSLTLQSQDLQIQIVDDARRAQLTSLSDFVKAQETAEKDATDKVKFAASERTLAKSLQSQIAAAKEKGDAQTVADLSIELQAVQTVTARAEEEKRNADQQASLDKQKARLDELKAAAAGVAGPSGLGAISGAAGTAGTALGGFLDRGTDGFRTLGGTITGKGGIIGAFAEMQTKGEEAGLAIKGAFDSIAGAAGSVVDIVGKVISTVGGMDKNLLGLGLIALGVATGNLPAALAGIALTGNNILNATPTTDPTGNAGPGKGSRVPYSAPVGGAGTSGVGSWVPSPTSSPVTHHTTINLDGKTIADVVDKNLFGSSQIYHNLVP